MKEYSLIDSGEVISVILHGNLDSYRTNLLKQDLLMNVIGYAKLEIDFRHVMIVDSSGVSVLVDMILLLRDKGISVWITNVQQDVHSVLQLLGIFHLLGEKTFV